MFGSEQFGFIRATHDGGIIKPAAPVSERPDDDHAPETGRAELSYAAVPQSITLAIHTNASGSNQMR
jgi:hypothetical protein